MMWKFVGLGFAMVLLNVVLWGALIAGGIWLAVYVLRALGVIPA